MKKSFRVTFDDGSVEEYSIEDFGDKLPQEKRLAVNWEIIRTEE